MANTVATLREMKAQGTKISMLTSYDYTTTKLIDAAGVDSILVGDSLGNVMLGYGSTVPVTVDDMIHHASAVVRGRTNAFVVVDMPFMSYQTGTRDALINAGRIMKEAKADAVKLEGGTEIAGTVKALVGAGIPVCAHVGLTPQHVNVFGGNKVQAKDIDGARKLLDDVKALEEAGAFAVVLECVPGRLGALASSQTNMITIGIGAGSQCDGQVLVYADMLGMTGATSPKMVRRFAEVGEMMKQAFAAYDEAVKDGSFPAIEETYNSDSAVFDQLENEAR